jgi:hypothetical protein
VSLYLRLVVGPVVVCDIELFGTAKSTDDAAPPQLNGGTGTLTYPEEVDGPALGFRPSGVSR